jgi:hypothetical protein
VSKPRIVQFPTNTSQLWVREFLEAEGITYEIGPPQRYDQFGEEYVTLQLGGPNYETGEPRLIAHATTEEFAKTAYKAVLLKWLNGRHHIIWRIEPELDCEKIGKFVERWTIYSRLSAPKR